MAVRAERRLEVALAAVARALARAKVPWMVIGGVAVIARGVRRMTTDVDVVVRGDAIDVAALLPHLRRAGVHPRITDAEAFARRNLVLLLRHRATGVDVDLSLGWSGFELEALAVVVPAPFGSIDVPLASAEDLVVYKVLAGRAKDLDDVAAILAMHPALDLARARRQLVELAALADEPAMLTRFEALVAARPRRPRAVGRRPVVRAPRARR